MYNMLLLTNINHKEKDLKMRTEKQITKDKVTNKKYRIERHGGRSNNAWRVVYQSDNPAKTKEKYNALWLKGVVPA